MISYIMLTAVGVLLVVLDQLTKYIIMQNVTYMTEEIPVIDNFFDIVHWHNTGGAWGALSENTWLLTVVSLISLILIIYLYSCAKPVFLRLSFILLAAGAIGNVIDRVRLGYVVDFLSFDNLFGYSFPAFNVADICVTSGCIGFFIYVIFMSRKRQAFRAGTFAARLLDDEASAKLKRGENMSSEQDIKFESSEGQPAQSSAISAGNDGASANNDNNDNI